MKHSRLTTGSFLAVLRPPTGFAAWLALTLGLCASAAHAQTITPIIDSSGDGGGNPLAAAQGHAVDTSGNG